MVEVEDRVARRAHGVAAGVTSCDVMTRGMDTPVVGITTVRRWRQQGVVEGVDVLGLGNKVVGPVCSGAERRVGANVAAHAARVGSAAARNRVLGYVVHHGRTGAEVGDIAVEVSHLERFLTSWLQNTNSLKGPSVTHPPRRQS